MKGKIRLFTRPSKLALVSNFRTFANLARHPKKVIVHRKVAEGAEGYLFLLFAETPKSKKTQPRWITCSHNPDLFPYTGQLKASVFPMIGLRDSARDICILRTCPVKFHPIDHLMLLLTLIWKPHDSAKQKYLTR